MKIINYLLISGISMFFVGCNYQEEAKPSVYQENTYIKGADNLERFDSTSKKDSNEVIFNSKKTNSLLICNPETTIIDDSIILKSNKEVGDLIENKLMEDKNVPKFGYMIFINGKYFNQLGAFQYDVKNFKTGSLNKIEIYKTYFVLGKTLNDELKYSDKKLYNFMNQDQFKNSYVSNAPELELYHFKKDNEFDFYYTDILREKEYKENQNYLIAEKIINKTFTMIDEKKYSVLLKNVKNDKIKYNLKFIDQNTFKGYDYYLNNYSFDCNLIKYKKILKNPIF